VLRAFEIRSNVIDNINGTLYTDNYRVLAEIPWNLAVISTALSNSDAKLAILNNAGQNIQGASSIGDITDIMTPINSTSFDTDTQPKMLGEIRTWLRGVQSIYTSPSCPIDISKVLQLNSATSTAI
jgi:hypothetical protein